MKKLITGIILSVSMLASTASAGIIESFQPTDTDGWNDSSGALLAFEYGEFFLNTGISFGWYLTDTGDNSIVDTMTIFEPQHHIGSGSTIAWDFTNHSAMASSTYDTLNGIGLEADWELGAFFNYNGNSIYSHDSLNANGEDLVNIEVIDWAGFDLAFSFTDSVNSCWGFCTASVGQYVKVSDVMPGAPNTSLLSTFSNGPRNNPTQVSEPATFAAFGIGLLGLVATRRKKSIK